MNLLLAAFLLSIGYWLGLPAVVADQTADLGGVRIQITQVALDSPASQAGIKMGAIITPFDKVSDMKKFIPNNVEGTTEYGGVVKIIISKDLGSQLNSGIFSLNSGQALVEDLHENDEVFYIIDGILTIESPGEETITVSKGEMVLISAGQVHYSKNVNDKTVEIFWCNIEPQTQDNK